MNSASAMIKAALYYSEKLNLSILPVSRNKIPIGAWEKYQTQKASPKEILEWYVTTPDAQLGIVTGKLSGVFVVDVDSEQALVDIEKYIPKDLKIPTVVTPRGGRHFYFSLPPDTEIRNATNLLNKVDIRGEGGLVVAPPSTNGNGKGWNWASGLKITDVDPPEPPDALLALILGKDSHFGTSLALSFNYNNNIIKDKIISTGQMPQVITDVTGYNIWSDGVRDENLFHVANSLAKTRNKPEYIRQVLTALVNSWGENDEKWVAAKVKSAMDRKEKRERSIAEEVRGWCLSQDGNFTYNDLAHDLTLITKEEIAAARMAISRLASGENPIIRKFGKKRGVYEPVIPEEDIVLDVLSPDKESIKLKLPLGVHKLARILPKNIIVLAGEVNAGKTAYLLNAALLNMDEMETVYFSSEMGEEELKLRLRNFDFPMEVWKKVRFLERSSDFAEKIRPNGLNIIDFLEIHTDFFMVGDKLREIFDKLDKGVAIVALQKNKGRDEGLGGERSKEKARLYMALEPGKLKIVKAKNWADVTVNPNGMEIPFKLARGCNFIIQ